MKKCLAIALISLTFSGCAYLSKKFESLTEKKNKDAIPTLVQLKNNYCAQKSNLHYIAEDESLLKFYKSLNPTIFENKNHPFVQKAIMLTLIELSRRPDEVSPYSRFQVYLKYNGTSYYYDFYPKNVEIKKDSDQKMPLLKGIDHLTQKFLPNKNLISIAANLDSIMPKNVGVSSNFEAFLRENSKELQKNENLSNLFFKGDEVLTKYETFERLSYQSIIKNYLSTNNAKDIDYEFTKIGLKENKQTNDNFQANCNYDLNKELSLRDEIMSSELKKTHTFGLSEDDNFFIAVSSSTMAKPINSKAKLGYVFMASPASFPLPICELKGKNQEIVLFSSNGRNPLQHLQHLVSYEIDKIESTFELSELLKFSRHLFLTNPDRILYESKRGRKAQLDFFLAMNFPIYHVETLGNVFGHATFRRENKTESSLYIDDRDQSRLWCK